MAQQINLQKIVTVKDEYGLFFLRSYNARGCHLQPFTEDDIIFVSKEKSRVLALGNIDLKLKEGSINILEIFKRLSENEEMVRLNLDINSLFESIIPELDRKIIPESHLLKILKWFHFIQIEFRMSEMINEEDDVLAIA